MATRRPNVPRATPAAAQPADAGPGAANDGGEVIQADFGGSRGGTATPATSASSGASAAPSRTAPPAAGKPAAKGQAAKEPSATGPASKGSGPKSPAAKGSGPSGSGAPARRNRLPAVGARLAPGKAGGKAPRRAGGSDETLDPVPAKAFSGRLLALGVVMIAITILLAPTVKIFLDKRAEIAALQADIAAKQTQQEDLKRQVSRWQDPNYVKQQARDRINMVMPGETGYWVFGSELPAATASSPTTAVSAQNPANLPWVDALWESIRRSATD
jgi:cell division protein FtsB